MKSFDLAVGRLALHYAEENPDEVNDKTVPRWRGEAARPTTTRIMRSPENSNQLRVEWLTTLVAMTWVLQSGADFTVAQARPGWPFALRVTSGLYATSCISRRARATWRCSIPPHRRGSRSFRQRHACVGCRALVPRHRNIGFGLEHLFELPPDLNNP
jgi:hypothetical protein